MIFYMTLQSGRALVFQSTSRYSRWRRWGPCEIIYYILIL